MTEDNNTNNKRSDQIQIEDKDLSIKEQVLEDIDREVKNFFENRIGLYIKKKNGEKEDVKVKLAIGERWNQIKHYENRDNKKNLILPVCAIQRQSIDILDDRYVLPHQRNLTTVIEGPTDEDKLHDFDSNNNNNNLQKNKYVVQTQIPPTVEISYRIVVQARYMKNMNFIIEQLTMNKNKGRITTDNDFYLSWEMSSFDDDSNVDDFTDDLRVFSNNFDFTVQGLINKNVKNNEYNTIRKFSPNKVTINENVD